MTILRAMFVLVLVSATLCGVACSRRDSAKPDVPSSDPSVINVDDDDPEMKRAIAEARATLPEFWSRLESPEEGNSDFALKVKMEDESGIAYVWLSKIERKNENIYGTLENESDAVKSVKAGERMLVNEEDISDWSYMRDGKIVGDRTTKALFSKMSPEEVEAHKRMMADP
jgi:uncharacterized protein YegJ (DUF2314 family)